MLKTIPSNVIQLGKRLFPLIVIYTLLRILFVVMNQALLQIQDIGSFLSIIIGGIRFDIAGISYIMLPIIISHLWYGTWLNQGYFAKFLACLYSIVNTFFLILTLMDISYYPFNLKRSGWDALQSLGNVTSELKIQMAREYWPIFIILAISFYFFYRLYFRMIYRPTTIASIPSSVLGILIITAATTIGARGGIQYKPIDENFSFKYAKSSQAQAVLNTPHVLLVSMTRQGLEAKHFFDEGQVDKIFPVIKQVESSSKNKKNIIIIIMEGCSQEWLSAYNPNRKTMMPFLDSLSQHCHIWKNMYSNSKRSAEGIPAILASLPPLMDEPFPFSLYQSNQLEGIGKLAENAGYSTLFAHGALKGSLAIDQMALQSGFQKTLSQEDYPDQTQYDGTWGIWDEQFLDFFSKQLSTLKQPFLGTIFTLSSHHPYKLPHAFDENIDKASLSKVELSFAYLDYSLKQFFKEISNTPWFSNSIFIITSDHSTHTTHPRFGTLIGSYKIPLFMYDPSQPAKKEYDKVVQQIDIQPTIAGMTGNEAPFFSFGEPLFKSGKGFSINYQAGSYRVVKDDYLYITDIDGDIKEVYNLANDPELRANIIKEIDPMQSSDISKIVLSIQQQYHNRMINNRLIYRK